MLINASAKGALKIVLAIGVILPLRSSQQVACDGTKEPHDRRNLLS